MKLKSRHVDQLIKDTLSNHKISDQRLLLDKINALGVDLTQSTLSRRLRKLAAAKINGFYTLLPSSDQTFSLLGVGSAPPNLLVLHTFPGHASAIASYLDPYRTLQGYKGLVGTIAGDDTVLVVVQDEEALLNIKQLIEQLFKPPSLPQ